MKKKLTALLLALCLFIGILPAVQPASAASFTVYVISNTLPVYKKVSTSSGLMGTMSFGENMTCIAYNDSWAAVQNAKGQIGYCQIAGLSNVNPNTLSKTAYITASNVPVYRKPTTSAGVMMKLSKNSKYTAVAVTPDQNWVRLQNGKYYGYVQSQYVSASPSGSGSTSTPSNSDIQNNLNTTVYIVSNTLKAYASASTSSRSLGTMSYGESMTLLATSGSWARIRNSAGAVGYCLLSGLSNVNPNSLNEKVFINADNIPVYRKPTTSAGVMMKLKLNSSYTAVAITSDGAWMRLKNGKYYGYVQSKYISGSIIQDEPEIDDPVEIPSEEVTETVYVSENIISFYAEPDDESTKLGSMAFGQSLGLISVDDGWAKVKNDNSVVGYCRYMDITRHDPNTLATTLYSAADGVQVLAQPVSGSAVTATLKINTALTMVATTPDGLWARLSMGNGQYAYGLLSEFSEKKVAEDDSPIQDITPKAVYISSTTLACYAENNTSSKILGTMSFGEMYTCTGSGEGWARIVNENGDVGFCKEEGLTGTNPNTYNVTLYAQTSSVKVYTKPSTSASALTTLALNTKVTGVCQSSDKAWVRIKSGSDYGYVQAQYLATTQIQNSETNSKIAKVVEIALAQEGIRYKYAAQSPSDGFDCSGLVYYAYKNGAGITLKRTAYTLATDSRYPNVARSDLKVGDLVFFNTVDDSDNYDHVGIYLGANKFVHASSGAGKVTTSLLTNSYYNRVYSGAKRIIQ